MKRKLKSALAGTALAAGFTVSAAWADTDYLAMSWDDITATAKKEGKVNVYAFANEDWLHALEKEYEAKYGIPVDIVIGDEDANLQKALAEKDQAEGTIDVYWLGGGHIIQNLVSGKMLYGPIAPKIPGIDAIKPEYLKFQEGVPIDGYAVPITDDHTGLIYNPDVVKNPPQTWDELVAFINDNPQQFAFNDPAHGGSGQAFVQSAIISMLGHQEQYMGDLELDQSKVADWGKVWEWFRSIKPNVVITNSNRDSLDRLNQGEVSMAAAWEGDTIVGRKEGTLPKNAIFYIPAFGMPGGADSFGILKNSPHKAAAMLFIAMAIGAEEQAKLYELQGLLSPRTDVVPPDSQVKAEDIAKNSRLWIAGPYKSHFIDEFVKQVLQQ
jgi:putative spermidine/putrescine transport system substrate-binding protein